MAEFIGFASGLVTLVGAVGRTVRMIRRLQDAPQELLALASEATDLRLAIEVVHGLVESNAVPAARLDSIVEVMGNVKEEVGKFDDYVKSTARTLRGQSVITRARWLVERHQAMAVQERLKAVRQQLMTAVTLTNA